MKRSFVTIALLVVSASAFAQDASFIQRRITDNNVLRGKFVEERVLKDFKQPLRSEGHFVIAPTFGLIWATDKPFSISTVITPEGLVQSVDGSETTRMSAERMPFMNRLYDMLSGTLAGNWAPLENDFVVTKTGNEQHWHVTLVPRKLGDPMMPFTAIDVVGSQFVDKVTLTKRGDESDTLQFIHQKLSALPLAPAEAAAFAPTAK